MTRPLRFGGAVAIAAALLSCTGQGAVVPLADAAAPLPPGSEVIFFGSSTTAGVGASARDRRWTTLLARAAGWRERNEGLPGSKLTDDDGPVPSAEERWRALADGRQPAAVIVMYGANDAWRGVPVGAVGQPRTFRNAAAVVLRGLRSLFPRAVLVVLTPQPARSLQPRRAPYDEALAAEAASVGAVLVRGGAAFPADELPRLGADAIHLNDRGQAALAAHVARTLSAAGLLAPARALGQGPLRVAR